MHMLGGTLPKTNSLHLKMDGWNTFSFPIEGKRPIFRGYAWLLVSGSVLYLSQLLRVNIRPHKVRSPTGISKISGT